MNFEREVIPTTPGELNLFIEEQLQHWPLAHANYLALGATERRTFMLGDFPVAVQHNPARIKSTGAGVDKKSIGERPCFLCRDNRPQEQLTGRIIPGWELLVNPYPIFPVHLTLPSVEHRAQTEIPLEMASMAEKMPWMAIFHNGARAGASAPDHAHLQAVLKSELPIVALAERVHNTPGIVDSIDLDTEDLPFRFFSAVITPDREGMRTLAAMTGVFGVDAERGEPDPALVNAFMWIDSEGLLRAVAVPRRRHRPLCYGTGEGQMLVSPGAVDMAGVIILPRKEDFERITPADVARIYSEVAFGKETCR